MNTAPAQAEPLFNSHHGDSSDSNKIARSTSPLLGGHRNSAVTETIIPPSQLLRVSHPETMKVGLVSRIPIPQRSQPEQSKADTPDVPAKLADEVVPVEAPAAEAPAVDTPAANPPAVDTPAVDTPDTSAANPPAVDTPAVETSETSAENAPAGEAPTTATVAAPADTSPTNTTLPVAQSPSQSAPLPQLEEPTATPEGAEVPEGPTEPAAPAPSENPGVSPATPPPSASAPAPDYLDPSVNPLDFPTQPTDVEIAGTQPITLQQAIALAVRNNPDLQQTRLQLTQAQDALREAQAANLPTLDAQTNLTLSGQDVPTVSLTGDSTRSTTDSTTLGGTLEANYNLYTSGRRSASIRAAEGTVRIRQLQVEVDTAALVSQVSTRYYNLQEADERVRIFQDALTQALQSLKDAQALERAGVGTRFDVLQSQVDVANAQQDLRNQLSTQEIARRQLVQDLSLAQSMDIKAADPVAVAGKWDLSLEDSIVQAYKNRAELEQQLVQRDVGEQRRRAALAALGPQVSLFGNYTIQNVVGASNSSSSSSGDTSLQYQLGARVSLSLFDGGVARAQAAQERRTIEIAESQFAVQRDSVRFQVEQAYSQLNASSENITTTQLAAQQAAEALRLSRLRFQAGVGTQSDVLRSQTELTRAQVNSLAAILDYNRALTSLNRAVSNLPDGNLGDTP